MRNLPQLSQRLYGRVWQVLPSHFRSLHEMLTIAKRANKRSDILEDLEDGVENPGMVIDKGIAFLPVYGTIGNNLSAFDKACFECADTRDIKKWIDQALLDDTVETILLDVNSPGGEITYLDEVVEHLYQAGKQKNTVAFCNDYMCSAAYHLASQCNEIYAHPGSTAIGAIGCYSGFLDEKQAYIKEGLEVQLFSAGKYKTEGFPGTSLSEDYKALLQKEIDESYTNFQSTVLRSRKIAQEDMDVALTYTSKVALEKGLIDGIVEDPMELFVK